MKLEVRAQPQNHTLPLQTLSAEGRAMEMARRADNDPRQGIRYKDTSLQRAELYVRYQNRLVGMGRSVPIAPGSGVVGQTLSSNVSEGLKCPGMGLRVERRVVCIVEQLRHRGQALLLGQHAGLGQAARSALAHQR